jgi:hypothetical protein
MAEREWQGRARAEMRFAALRQAAALTSASPQADARFVVLRSNTAVSKACPARGTTDRRAR